MKEASRQEPAGGSFLQASRMDAGKRLLLCASTPTICHPSLLLLASLLPPAQSLTAWLGSFEGGT